VVSMLGRMLWRDLWHLRGPLMAAALVVACGIAVLVALRGTHQSLLLAQSNYYQSHRLADVFAHLRRAPDSLAEQMRQWPGVAQVQTRLVVDVTVDVPGLAEPAMAKLVSVPGTHRPVLNDVQLVRGRYLDAGASDQVLVSEAFALANGLQVGDTLGAVLHGRQKSLVIVGIALSPEFVYEVGSGMIFPDNRRYGVMWIAHEALAPAFDMQGAFNDVSVSLGRDASEPAVIAALDGLLLRYGGLSAHGRDLQLSHRFLSDELGELGVMTTALPSLFLVVSAFLLYLVLSRLVATQRPQIGLLKAFGFRDWRVGLHYFGFAGVTVLIGLWVGVPVGLVLGQMFVDIYRDFFHFPSLHFVADPALMGLCVGVSLLSAGAGALLSVRRAMGLAPAEAIRPESPVSYRAGTWLLQGWTAGLPASVRMIGRNLLRRPWHAVGSVLGIACAMGLLLLGRFAMDAPQHMLSVQFNQVQRDDVMVTYNEARGPRALLEMAAMDGVIQVEPFRALPAWLQHGHRRKRIDVMGLMPGNGLHQLLDARLQPVDLPPQGLVLSAKLADILGLAPGDRVSLEALEGRRPVLDMPVVSVVDEMLGLGAYMDAAALARLLGEDHTSSGAYLRIEADKALQVYERLKRMPAVAGVAVAQATQQSVRETMARAFFFFSGILLVFACVIIAGMVYNSARIALSERGNELASLAVLGFTQREVAFLLLGEQVALLALAVPVGLGVGYGLCALLVPLFDRDLFRVPLVLRPWSYAYAVLAAWGASVLSGLLVARRIRRLDLIAVLKTRE
jgi:putative ABC transport system permease protein